MTILKIQLAFCHQCHENTAIDDHEQHGRRDSVRIFVMSEETSGSTDDKVMMTSWNGNIFCVAGHLCGEFTGPRWIPRTNASDAGLWYFIWSASE